MRQKSIQLLFAVLLLISSQAIAQWDNGTSTNPQHPNPSTGVGANLWDWTNGLTGTGTYSANGNIYYKINPFSSLYQNYSVPPIQGQPIGIESPYYNSASTQLSTYLAFGANSDYNWADGWELITRNFGYASDEVTAATTDAIVPYFILYNKYSGTLRVFGVLPTRGGGSSVNSVTVELKFLTPNDEQNNAHYQGYKYSALLGVNGGSSNPDPTTGIPYGKAQALDMPTTVNNISKVAPFTGYDNQFFYADFAVGYDPCSCWSNGGLQISFFSNITGSIQLDGRFVGTSVSIASVQNGDNSQPDPIHYLAGVNSENGTVKAGTLTYDNINSLQADYASKNSSLTAQDVLDVVSKGTAFLAKEEAMALNEEAAAGLEVVSALSDFISVLLPKEGEREQPPSVIQGEMKLSGTLNMTTQNPEAYVKVSIPGTPSVSATPPEFYTASNPIPNYPKYNEVLGPFALLQTPAATVSDFKIPFIVHGGSITNYYYRYEIQVNDAIKYIFNPAVHANLSESVILAALELEYVGGKPNGNVPLVNGMSVHGAHWNYTTQLDPQNSNFVAMHYTTEYVDPSQLSNLVIAIENNGGLPSQNGKPDVFNLYLKLIVDLVSNDLKKDNQTPNQSVMMFSFPITVSHETQYNSASSPTLTGFPLTVNTYTDIPAAESLTIGTTNYSTTDVQYVWDNVTITGALTTNAGVSESIKTYDGIITMNPGSSLSPGMSLSSGKTVYPANPNTGNWSGTGNLQSWCSGAGNSSLPNPYKGNTLGDNIAASRISEKPTSYDNSLALSKKLQGNFNVYPVPVVGASRVEYTIPTSGEVEIAIYDVLGEKVSVVVEGAQDAGNYTTPLPSDKLSSGIYFLRIEATNYNDIRRFVVVK